MNIYVSNLSFSIGDADLKGFFEVYGNVSSAKVVMDKYTQRSRGFGFVEMDNKEEAEKAIAELNGATVENREMAVAEARPKEERSSKPSFSGNRW
jgi:RNA recognition motif-containing protein